MASPERRRSHPAIRQIHFTWTRPGPPPDDTAMSDQSPNGLIRNIQQFGRKVVGWVYGLLKKDLILPNI